MSQHKILEGRVFHARSGSIKNAFSYPIFNFLVDCAHEASLRSQLKKNLWRFFSLKNKDYLQGNPVPFSEGVNDFLQKYCKFSPASVTLVTLPRFFGFAFNPVSFWLCHENNQLHAVLSEVNNTFGERHFYWVQSPQGLASQEWWQLDKVFHVSPFFPVDGFYRFRFQESSLRLRIDINYYAPNGDLRLATWIEGDLKNFSATSPSRLFFRYGWITPLIVLRIHWQALRLFLKRATFFSKPLPPTQEITQ